MFHFFKTHNLILMLPLAFALYYLAFEDTAIFWYMYTFSLLVLMSAGIIFNKVFDEMATWKSLIYGLFFGALMYGILAAGFYLLKLTPFDIEGPAAAFLSTFAPISLWHYLLLMFIIVPGEEIFWRGFVQQQLKRYFSVKVSILISAVLFGLIFAICGFTPGILAGAIVGVILGFLYEWKKSMPLLIIAHLILIVLLFLIFPLAI